MDKFSSISGYHTVQSTELFFIPIFHEEIDHKEKFVGKN